MTSTNANATRRIKWGILGTSWISGVIAEAIKESETSELIAIGSRSIENAKKFAKQHQIPNYFADHHELLHHPDVDVVYIGLPNHLHKEWIIQCAEAGKHILCEKPLTINLQETQEALAAVKKFNVFCMEGLMYRCHPFIKELQNLIDEKVIGEVKCINAVYTANIANIANTTAGGAIRNLGCYPVSLIRLLAKAEPVSITAHGKLNDNLTSDNISTAILKFENGLIATVTTADNIEMWSQFTILGTKGIIDIISNPWLPDKQNKIKLKTADKDEILIYTAEKSLFTYQIDCVADHINKGIFSPENPAVTWEHSLGNTAVLETWLKQVKESETAQSQ